MTAHFAILKQYLLKFEQKNKIIREYKMEKLIEYEWPAESGNCWFIFEHVGNFLSVKSFHRKHKGSRVNQL